MSRYVPEKRQVQLEQDPIVENIPHERRYVEILPGPTCKHTRDPGVSRGGKPISSPSSIRPGQKRYKLCHLFAFEILNGI